MNQLNQVLCVRCIFCESVIDQIVTHSLNGKSFCETCWFTLLKSLTPNYAGWHDRLGRTWYDSRKDVE